MAALANQAAVSGFPALAPTPPPPPVDAAAPLNWENQNYDSPRLPPLVTHDVADNALEVNDPPAAEKQEQDSPWTSGSDSLDFSGLYYDYAPLGHLQERLEPIRLPESNYLFGREDVDNHLLDERLAVEEPFQAAMGLVLLSKLGLQW